MTDTKATDVQGLKADPAPPPPPDAVTVTLDGRDIQARKGELVIAAAERNGVYIPRFCYHPRMDPVGMCRMCLVEIDTGRGPALQPSCMIECTDGMKVVSDSRAAEKAQEGVLEFLLINHPLDCPVCDKGGECPLQDQTMAYGPGESRFVEEKRHYEKPIPVSDLVLLDRERCILCDRCTRFAKDVAGDPLIHFLDRGNETQVNTFPDHPFASYFSGNTVQICPVGALTATPYRFKARPWDLEVVESTCTSCSVGCRVTVESSRNMVVRKQGVDVDPVNWGWMCDKGRFDFEAINSDERLGSPLVRDEGLLLEPATWADAMERATTAVGQGLDRSGAEGVAVLGGARLTNEAAYAWTKLAKGLIGTDNVDCQLDDGLPAEAALGLPRATIDQACQPGGVVLLLGPDPREELPVFYLRLRHAVLRDDVVLVELSSTATGTSHLARHSLHYRPGELYDLVEALLRGDTTAGDDDSAGAGGGRGGARTEVAGVRADQIEDVARLLGERPLTVLLGRGSLAEAAEPVAQAAKAIHQARPEARFLSGLRRGNVHGALDMGMAPGLLPGRGDHESLGERFQALWPQAPEGRGLDAAGILQAAADGKIDTLFLIGADPLNDFPDRSLAERGLAGARTVIACDLFLTESVRQADVVLPVAGYAEVSGTTTNLEGRVSTVAQKVTPPGTAQPDWVIAADFAQRLDADLGITSPADVWQELSQVVPAYASLGTSLLTRTTVGGDGVLLGLPRRRNGGGPDHADAESSDGSTEVAEDDAETAGDTAETVTPAGGDAQAVTPAAGGDPTLSGAGDMLPPGDEGEVLDSDAASVSLPDWTVVEPPMVDAFSLRLVASRKLYDRGTLVRHSPSLVGQAEGAVVRLNPYDFQKLGISAGDDVRVASARTHVLVPARPSDAVPRGLALLHVNQGGGRVNALLQTSAVATDVRVERA